MNEGDAASDSVMNEIDSSSDDSGFVLTISPQPASRTDQVMLLIALVVGFALTLSSISRPLELDEHVSYWIADSNGPGTLLERSMSYSATPPAYFAVQNVFHRATGNIRSASLICFIGSIIALWWLCRNHVSSQVACFAPLFLATHPVTVQFATMARPYSFGVLMAILSVLATIRFKSQPSLIFGATWFLSNLVLVQTHYLFGVIWLAQVLFLSWRVSDFGVQRLFLSCVLLVVAAGTVMGGLVRIWSVSTYLNWKPDPPGLGLIPMLALPVDIPLIPIGASTAGFMSIGLFITVLSLAFAGARGENKRALSFCYLWFLVPTFFLWALARWIPSMSSLAAARYLVVFLPGFFVLAATALCVIPNVAPRFMVAFALVLATGTASKIVSLGREQAGEKIDTTDELFAHAAAKIESEGTARDLILVGSGLVEMRLVPGCLDDATFHDYVSCRVGRIWSEDENGALKRARRMALPMFWTPESQDHFRKVIQRYALPDQPHAIWVVAAIDTDLLRATAMEAKSLLDETGFLVADHSTERVMFLKLSIKPEKVNL